MVRGNVEQEIKGLEGRIDEGKERDRGLRSRVMEAESRAEDRNERLTWAKDGLEEAKTDGFSAGRVETGHVGKSKGKGEIRGGIRIMWTGYSF